MDVASVFATHIAKTRYDDLPPQAIEATKKSILDALGNTLAAGTVGQGCAELVGLVKHAGGRPESTILGFSQKTTSWMAAFANGALSHSLDFNDTYDAAALHPGIVTVPAALAVGERVGASGTDVLTAVALGADVVCRLGLACGDSGVVSWMPSHLHGVFSSAAVAGKLLGLSEPGLVSSFGIALAQAGGTMQTLVGADSVLRGLYAAFPSQAGVLSALLAETGISGPTDSIEGEAGLFQAFYRGKYNRERLLAGLGEVFEGANASFKPWPCGRITHPYIEATLSVLNENGVAAEEIVGIIALAGEYVMALCRPMERRLKPTTTMDAKASVPFCVAVAAIKRKVGIADFMVDALADASVLQMAQKVRPRFDAGMGGPLATVVPPGAVEVETKSGHTFHKRVDFALGHPNNPLSADGIANKFRECVRFSRKQLSEATIDQVIEMVFGLEQVDDIRQLVDVLA